MDEDSHETHDCLKTDQIEYTGKRPVGVYAICDPQPEPVGGHHTPDIDSEAFEFIKFPFENPKENDGVQPQKTSPKLNQSCVALSDRTHGVGVVLIRFGDGIKIGEDDQGRHDEPVLNKCSHLLFLLGTSGVGGCVAVLFDQIDHDWLTGLSDFTDQDLLLSKYGSQTEQILELRYQTMLLECVLLVVPTWNIATKTYFLLGGILNTYNRAEKKICRMPPGSFPDYQGARNFCHQNERKNAHLLARASLVLLKFIVKQSLCFRAF